MKKVLQINVTKTGSTGSIMREIDKLASKKYKTEYYYGRGNDKSILSKIDVYFSVFLSRFFSMNNSGAFYNTYKLINYIKKYNPDIIHLHNVHGYYLNLTIFFRFLHRLNIPIVWTLHDCSSYTGHCAYYTTVNCSKWQKKCYNCPQLREYPCNLIFDSSTSEYNKKKKLFANFKNLTLVVPSNWLGEQVKKSFLKNYPLEVIHNAIDTKIFKPIYDEDIYNKYKIPKKRVILGVANIWDERKGIKYFLNLANIISKQEVIVLVGLNDTQIKSLPKNIIGIKRTENILELIKLYSIADVFFNPSFEETFSMVTLEALACGIPCLVFNKTATPELITKDVGIIINEDFSIANIYKNLQKLSRSKYQKKCIERAEAYDLKNYQKYIDLYDKLMEE